MGMMRGVALAAGLATAVVFGAVGGPASAATVSISCGSVGADLDFCREGAEAWAKKTGNSFVLVPTPPDSTERLGLYQLLLAAGTSDIDVYMVDVVWPGILGTHFIDLAQHFDRAKIERENFPNIVKNNTVDGRLVAMPWFTDAGLLYYRKDLLQKYGRKPPQTWEELGRVAEEVQAKERAAGNPRMQGFVFQAAASESLTCNALEWIDSARGGTIVADDGSVTIDNPRAIEPLDTIASWVGTIAPRGVLSYTEEEARGVFQPGNAVFMRNWPYAWPIVNAEGSAVKDKVGIAVLPKWDAEGKTTGTLGGYQLAVSKYSENAEAAIDLVRYLAGPEEQKRRAVEGGYTPTLQSLYKDPDVLKANPYFGELYGTFLSAVARPSRATGLAYNQVSAEFYNAVYSVLQNGGGAGEEFADLAERLNWLARRWRDDS